MVEGDYRLADITKKTQKTSATVQCPGLASDI